MDLYGLIGMPLTQSFSKKYFTEKFEKENISGAVYELFPLEHISSFSKLLQTQPQLKGLNVTIPYKEQVIPFLQELSDEAREMGAVNCIKKSQAGLKGFNTDAPAFKDSLLALLQPHHQKALVLGTGGAAKAVVYVLKSLGIEYQLVSRDSRKGLTYDALTKDVLEGHLLIINTTPLGSFPKIDTAPPIPYELLTRQQYLYDLVYNPAETLFLQKGKERGASIKNGYEMLVGQAELSWKIWNDCRI